MPEVLRFVGEDPAKSRLEDTPNLRVLLKQPQRPAEHGRKVDRIASAKLLLIGSDKGRKRMIGLLHRILRQAISVDGRGELTG